MTLRNISIEPKPEREKRMSKKDYEKSSDILVFNVYDQDWRTLQEKGLTHLFASEADFLRRKGMTIRYEKLPQPR